MAIANTTVEVNINVPEKLAKVRSPAFQIFAAQTWHKLYRDYCPNQTGTLYGTVVIQPLEIHHIMPYAGAVYRTNRNYRKDKAPKASAKWDLAAAPAEKPKLIATMQKYVDSGRLNLNGK